MTQMILKGPTLCVTFEVNKIFLRVAKNVQPMRMQPILCKPIKDERGITSFFIRIVKISLLFLNDILFNLFHVQ
jgi:hypothetical protein